jgi:beta-glucosidase/6-phospho-beta-glucosidase/beta-galactosidase
MANYKKKLIVHNTNIPSLSSCSSKTKMTKNEVEVLNKKVFDAINNLELQKSLDKWLKENQQHQQIAMRDLSLLKSIITEYLDGFILFGYNIEGERVILQSFKNAKERDAMMEFLKIVFIKQQQDNFLDD